MYGPVKAPSVSNRMIDGHRIGELGVLQHLRQVDAHHVLRWKHICTWTRPCVQLWLYKVGVTDGGGISVDYRMDNHVRGFVRSIHYNTRGLFSGGR